MTHMRASARAVKIFLSRAKAKREARVNEGLVLPPHAKKGLMRVVSGREYGIGPVTQPAEISALRYSRITDG